MANNNVGGVELELRRDLGFFDVTMIGIGAMIGAGIFVLTGYTISAAGPAALIVFSLNGIIAGLTALTYMELGSCFPQAGGSYLWVREGMPHPFGFLSGWMDWMAHTIACTLYALGFGSYLTWAFKEGGVVFSLAPIGIDYIINPAVMAKVFAVIIAIILLGVNYMGTGTTGKTENIVTVAKIITLFIFIGFGVYAMLSNPHAISNFTKDFLPNELGFGGIAYGMGLTFIAFQGFEVITQCGEEVKEPRKNIPKAIMISMIVVIIIYIAITIVSIGGINTGDGESWRFFDNPDFEPELAMVEASRSFMEPLGLAWLGFIIMIFGGLVSTISALNATVFSSSRVSFAMGRDGTLPSALGKIHSTRRTPYNAIFISGIILIIMALSLPIADVAAAAGVMFLILFSFANISLITLRRKMPYLKRGFVVPFVPYIPLIATGLNIAVALYLFQRSPVAWYIAIGWIEAGLIGYYFTRGKQEISDLEKVEKMIGLPRRETGKKYHVLVPIANPKNTELIDFAGTIAKHQDGDMILLNIAAIPDTIPIQNVDYEFVKRRVRVAEELSEYSTKKHGVVTRAKVVVSHKIRDTILETVHKEKANFTMIGWTGRPPRGRIIFGYNIDDIIQFAKSDVAILRGPTGGRIDRIMLLPGYEHHGVRASELAAFIAKEYGATVTLVGLLTPDKNEVEVKTRTGYLADIIRNFGVEVEDKTIRTKRPLTKLVKMAKDYDMMIVGAGDKWQKLSFSFGPEQDALASKVDTPFIMIRAYDKEERMISTSALGEDDDEDDGGGGPDRKLEEVDEIPPEDDHEVSGDELPAEEGYMPEADTVSEKTEPYALPVTRPVPVPVPVPADDTAERKIGKPGSTGYVEGAKKDDATGEPTVVDTEPGQTEDEPLKTEDVKTKKGAEDDGEPPAVKPPPKLPIIPEEMEDEEPEEGEEAVSGEDGGEASDADANDPAASSEDGGDEDA